MASFRLTEATNERRNERQILDWIGLDCLGMSGLPHTEDLIASTPGNLPLPGTVDKKIRAEGALGDRGMEAGVVGYIDEEVRTG